MILVPDPIEAISPIGPCLVVAIDRESFLVIDEGGLPSWVSTKEVMFNWRFDWVERRWLTVDPYEGENGNSEEEEANDGGQEVPGRFSDVDGAGGSDSGDWADGEARGLDSREDSF